MLLYFLCNLFPLRESLSDWGKAIWPVLCLQVIFERPGVIACSLIPDLPKHFERSYAFEGWHYLGHRAGSAWLLCWPAIAIWVPSKWLCWYSIYCLCCARRHCLQDCWSDRNKPKLRYVHILWVENLWHSLQHVGTPLLIVWNVISKRASCPIRRDIDIDCKDCWISVRRNVDWVRMSWLICLLLMHCRLWSCGVLVVSCSCNSLDLIWEGHSEYSTQLLMITWWQLTSSEYDCCILYLHVSIFTFMYISNSSKLISLTSLCSIQFCNLKIAIIQNGVKTKLHYHEDLGVFF